MKNILLQLTAVICALVVSQVAMANNLKLDQEVEILKIKIALSVLNERDQKVRLFLNDMENKGYTLAEIYSSPSYSSYSQAIDNQNQTDLKSIIAKIGWPSSTIYGENAEVAAWEVVQHADNDLAFQKKGLQLIKNENTTNKRIIADIAYLEDRILLHEGKPQIYGTQARCFDNHHFELRPIVDIANVDKRRKSVGIMPIAEYKKMLAKNMC